MFKKIILPAFGLILAFGSVYGLRQTKIGYIDVDEVLNTYPGIDDIRQRIMDERKKYQIEIDKRKEEIEILEKENTGGLSEEEKLRREAELSFKREQLGELISDSNSRVAAFKEEITKPVFLKIATVIQEVCVEKGFSFVFRKGSDILLFVDKEFDITDDVKQRLRKDLNLE